MSDKVKIEAIKVLNEELKRLDLQKYNLIDAHDWDRSPFTFNMERNDAMRKNIQRELIDYIKYQ